MKNCYAIRLSEYRMAIADVCEFEPEKNTWLVTRINVPEEHRGAGYGTELLRQIVEDADAEEVTLILEVASYGDLSNEMLSEWYQRYGFSEVEYDNFGTLFLRQPESAVAKTVKG